MPKTLIFALFAAALLAFSLRSVPPVTAAVVSSAPKILGVAAMPAPQEPLDTTPISAVETVGATRGE